MLWCIRILEACERLQLVRKSVNADRKLLRNYARHLAIKRSGLFLGFYLLLICEHRIILLIKTKLSY